MGRVKVERDGPLVVTLCGVVERMNKLVYDRALRARSKPEIGDIIISCVIEDAVLMLSSMNLPDGIQAEVRAFQHDGCIHLQARSQKYGKLRRGQVLTIPPYLEKKCEQHIHYLDQYGIDLILGCNGFIGVGEHVEVRDDMVEDLSNKSEQQNVKPWNEEVEETYNPLETRQYICRTANAIRVLSALGLIKKVEVVMEIVNLSMSLNLDIHEMLGADFYVILAEKEAECRSLSKRR
ncbi:Exosomal 3'-5' exoribonuclease complex, subunit Rrp4 [Handroanthus impetiginosus]|uniref:Exosomal 3'-5' exoribonuclease complex, subunit Rrp4 n=1 Tax=Handroanthus impetiginosus TaxID=429701 RepID=A0A2G9I8I9_9LAMI|nr:Exosomal 3'-5' exoribonuclease complex, subunit Rrp4 [Handroanthus impetiginosus]